jgi:endonuclease YncB( thermonuclease family)
LTSRSNRSAKGALLSALFSFCLPLPIHAESCGLQGVREWARVAHVYDGDTVRLNDGRRVRLIGIDSPEVAREQQPAEPLAERAEARLEELIAESGYRVGLRPGREGRDDYGRLLAHLFDQRGSNLSAALLSEGLAVILPVPPNLALSECYRRTEAAARAAGRGIWTHPDYLERPAAALTGGDVGTYRVVRGRVTRVGHSRSSVWINLGEGFAVRIHRADLERFPYRDWDRLEGRALRARGRIYARNDQLRLRVRHPDLLELLD